MPAKTHFMKTVGLALRRYDCSMDYGSPSVYSDYDPASAPDVDPASLFGPDRFQRYILGVIDEMVSIHRETWGRSPRVLLLGDWLHQRMRGTFFPSRPVETLRVLHDRNDQFPLAAALSSAGDNPEPRRVETETVTEHLPRLRGLIVRRAVGHDEYHIDVQ